MSVQIETTLERLHAAVKATMLFSSVDFTRPHLCGILIEVSADRLNIVATDGHALAAHTLARTEGPTADAFVSTQNAKALEVALRCSSKEYEWPVTLSVGENHIAIRRDAQETRIPAVGHVLSQHLFPAWRKVVPPPRKPGGKGAAHIGAAAHLLGRVASAAKTFTPKGQKQPSVFNIQIPKDPTDAIRLDLDFVESTATYVVMPVRL